MAQEPDVRKLNSATRAVPRALQLGGGVNSKIYRRNPLKNRKKFSGDNFF